MKPVAFIGGLAVAAALGAAACYLVIHRPPGGQPGGGAVVCPGNGACPIETKGLGYYGFAVPHALSGVRVFLCDGTATAKGCVKNYVGIAVRLRSTDKLAIKKCVDGAGPCEPHTDMIYCEVDPANTNPGPCPVYAHEE